MDVTAHDTVNPPPEVKSIVTSPQENNMEKCSENVEQIEPSSTQSAVSHRVQRGSRNASQSIRKHRLARRRILRSRSSQSQAQMASLVQRLIAIEERRLENRRLMLCMQENLSNSLMEISASMSGVIRGLMEQLSPDSKAFGENIIP